MNEDAERGCNPHVEKRVPIRNKVLGIAPGVSRDKKETKGTCYP